MESDRPLTPVYLSGDLRVDVGRARLFRNGEVVPLEPKAFDLLCFLLEHRDRLVTKEELLDTIWAGTFVTPNALTRTVAQLRKSLGDDAREARYIETAARRGYRFIAPVEVVVIPAEAREEEARQSPAPRLPMRTAIFGSIALVVILGLIAAIVALARRRPAEEAIAKPVAKLERVTTRLGYNAYPSVSPDGSRIAYASDESGSLEIHVMGLAPGARDVAITSDDGQNTQPAWSPDGQWIAFHSRRRGGIWIVPSTGGAPAQVTDFGAQPSWSPDSKRLVFTADSIGGALPATLWTVGRDGSDLKQLTKSGMPVGVHRSPRWAHNGRWVLFPVYQGVTRGSLYAVDVRSGKVTKVLGDVPHVAVITPGDDAIVFRRFFGRDNQQLKKLSIDPLTGTPRGTAVLLRELPGPTEGMSAGADGTIFLGISATESNLWSIDANGTTDAVRLTDSAVRVTVPRHSRAGKIAYSAAQAGQITSWMIDSDGKNREAILIDPPNRWPSWTADGRRVLVLHHDEKSRDRLSWVDLATRRMTPTGVTTKEIYAPALSPGGDEVAYHAFGPDGLVNVWREKLDGSAKRQVTFDAEGASYPAWSPDGRQLAVEIERGDSVQIALVSRDGGPLRMLTNTRGQSWPHSWSPDGKWIAFAGERAGVWNVYKISVDTAEVRQLTRYSSAEGYVRYPDWSPDGSRIVFERGGLTAGIWKLEIGEEKEDR